LTWHYLPGQVITGATFESAYLLILCLESGVVIIRIVQSFEPDLPGLDEYIMKYPNYSTVTNSLNTGSKMPISSCVISEHLKYRLCPKSYQSSTIKTF
jgi:hypothetical protein